MASAASLKARIARLDKELARREELERNHSSKPLQTNLPKVDQWGLFAPRTYIVSGDETGNKIVPFRPYKIQTELHKRIQENARVLVLKSRQTGISEEICSIILNRALTEPGFTAVVISKNQKDSSKLARRVKFMANSIRGEKLEWDANSLTELSWVGRGTIHFLPATADSGRGIPACAFLFFDEGAFIENVEDIYQGAAPTMAKLGKAGKTVIVSTPDMESNWYGTMWHSGLSMDWYDYVERRDFAGLQAMLDTIDDGWCRFVVHYSMHPEYGKDPGWAERNRKLLKYTQARWDAEFELKFGSTASAIYPSATVKKSAIGAFTECGIVRRQYVMGVDPNGGGSDFFTSIVVDITKPPYSVVNLYRAANKASPYSQARVVEQINNYLPSFITVEANSMGVVIAENLQNMVHSGPIETIFMSRPTKNVITDRVLYLMEEGELIFPDGIIAQELRAFRLTDKGERCASSGHHDDCVMALALACTQVPNTVDLDALLKAL